MTSKRQWRLEWGEDGVAYVDSVAALDRLLEGLAERARARPFMAELISPAGDSLALGLGREQSVLSWAPASQDPPYFASKGDSSAEGTIVFHHRDAWSEFPGWSAVQAATAARRCVTSS